MGDSDARDPSPVDPLPSPVEGAGVAGCGILGIQRRQWPVSVGDFHAGLLQVILAHERDDPGLTVSNVGGWHSHPDLHLWAAPCVAPLLERIRAAAAGVTAEPMRMHAWANVLRNGGHHLAHRHGEAWWSGVYYVAAGDRTCGGAITFAKGGNCETITPQDGLMLLFPGALLHSVATYSGVAPRVSIAFNLFP